jgi:threonine/homoserine/homoserine lactone efflux protein
VFGSRKSRSRVFTLATVITIVSGVYLIGVSAAAHRDFGAMRDLPAACGWMPLVSAILLIALARYSGPHEIRDTMWAFVDVEA